MIRNILYLGNVEQKIEQPHRIPVKLTLRRYILKFLAEGYILPFRVIHKEFF